MCGETFNHVKIPLCMLSSLPLHVVCCERHVREIPHTRKCPVSLFTSQMQSSDLSWLALKQLSQCMKLLNGTLEDFRLPFHNGSLPLDRALNRRFESLHCSYYAHTLSVAS